MRRPRPSPAPLSRALILVPALIAGACHPAAPVPPPPPPAATVVAPVVAVALTPAQIAARGMPSVVRIQGRQQGLQRLGTGFVVRKDGWIATNLHVIAGAPELLVTTTDGHEYPVLDVLAIDEIHDLALVRIDGTNLGAVSLGSSELVRPGDSVVAIGHPMGLEDTVSNGLVSAVRVIDPALTVLQISAPIAPGSSGGPLFSDKGEVIGVVSSFRKDGQNLNFGVPIDYLKVMLDDTHPVPLAMFAEAHRPPPSNLPAVHREVPHHDVKLLAGCSDHDLERAAHIVAEAIEVGAPVYNEKHFAACYHIYEGAALVVEKSLPAACTGPKHAMHDGRTRAEKLDDPSLQAWAMRDAFDGLIEVIMRRLKSGQ